MKRRLHAFIDLLRNVGLPVTVSETLDAVSAVTFVGVERAALREGLAATLLKDEADRVTFDAVFDRCFPLIGRRSTKRQHSELPGDAGTGGTGKSGTQFRPAVLREDEQDDLPKQHVASQQRTATFYRGELTRTQLPLDRRRLQATPFAQLSPRDIQACDLLLAELVRRLRAHLTRRQRKARRGRLDIRRTIRLSISKGGVPIEPAFRRRRPGAPDLVALCDASHSVATATRFLFGLLQPAQEFFRRTHLFAFVDTPVEVSVRDGTLIPHGRLDLYARSDFGKVLMALREQHESLLTRNTILLVLGDARNNRRPPRADLLARMRNGVRRVVWLNPEPVERWNTGDSVVATYSRYCDEVFPASTIQELHTALRRSLTIG